MPDELTDLKLEAVEARPETRFVELSSKIDRVADSMNSVASRVIDSMNSVASELRIIKSDNTYTRWTIIVTVVGAVLAALGVIWVTQANMLASFQAGIALRTETKEAPSVPSPPPAPAQPKRSP
jgi:hypothetical protein